MTKSNPLSTRYWQPILIRFVKGALKITQEEIEYVDNVIKTLQNKTLLLEGRLYSIKQTIMLTMVDVKVYNATTEQQRGATFVGLPRKKLII